jgi:hypothetical protein
MIDDRDGVLAKQLAEHGIDLAVVGRLARCAGPIRKSEQRRRGRDDRGFHRIDEASGLRE